MSYNSQVKSFVVGDLVMFTGYEVESPPLAHKIGIVLDIGSGAKPHRLYRVLWLHNGIAVSVSGKHLQLAYELKEQRDTT